MLALAALAFGPSCGMADNLFVTERSFTPPLVYGGILNYNTALGTKSTLASGGAPTDLAVDGSGNLFVSDQGR